MSAHEDLRVPVLTKTSYQRWKFEVIACPKSVDVYEVVDGTDIYPTGKADEIKEWQKKDAKAIRILSGSLSDDDHSAIRECKTSKAIFIKIKSLYEMKTEANKYLLNQTLHAMKFKDGQSVQSYCSELAVIVQQLEAIGEKISDATLVAKLINDLPAKFDTFRETYYIQAVSDRTIKFDDIRQQLVLIESRASDVSNKSDSGDALVTRSQTSSNNKRSSTVKKSRNKREYYECHTQGHFRRDCRKYKARIAKEQAQNKSTEANQTYSKSLMLTCRSAYTVTNGQDSWIGDSGASNHMTYRKDIFTSFEEINDDSFPITVGNNEVIHARGKGTVDVKSLSGREVTLTNVLYVPKLGRSLLSLGAATKMQINVKFGNDILEMSRDGRLLATGHRLSNNIYEMDFIHVGGTANIGAQEATLRV